MKNLCIGILSIGILTAVLVISCGGEKPSEQKQNVPPKTTEPSPVAESLKNDGPHEKGDDEPEAPPEGRSVLAFRDGKMEKLVESQATDAGLTIIDLSNYWVPFLFSERSSKDEERKPNTYRAIFRKLANDWPYLPPSLAEAKRLYDEERGRARRVRIAAMRAEGVSDADIRERLGLELSDLKSDTDTDTSENSGDEVADIEDDPEHSGAGDAEHYLEVYGIPPSLSVLRRRAMEEISRECYNEIDFKRIQAYDGFMAYRSNNQAKNDARRARSFAVKMRREMEKLGVEDAALLADHPKNTQSKKLIETGIQYEALIETQKQLVCEGLYNEGDETRFYSGGLDWRTHEALVKFERKNRIFGWGYFGGDTIKALGKSPQARLYDAFVRVINERVVDATEIIEDGSARGADGEAATYRDLNGEVKPVPNLVAEFTALTLHHMGISTPDKLVTFLKSFSDEELDTLYVAVPLSELPPYYSDEMDFHAVIDRGDVWYEYPYTMEGKRIGQPRKNMPMTTLYVKWNGQEIPLVRMNTTIGSWRTEWASDGYEYFKYKESDVGPRVWKDIIAGPVWMPPDSTPPGDLTKKVSYRHQLYEVPNYSEFGPSYASAYGLVAAFHYRQIENRDGSFRYNDNGIRSHGSVDYNSILRRYSHGCHRLYNHLAIRLFNFIIHHKNFVRVGQIPAGFSRIITTKNEAAEGDTDDENTEENTFTIKLDTRGYKYELVNPVPVDVEKGIIRGRQKTPIEGYMPKPNEAYGPDAQFLPPEYEFLKEGSDTDTDNDNDTATATSAVASDTATAAPKPADTGSSTAAKPAAQ